MARLHEYQGKQLLAQHGFAIPRGGPADSEAAARDVAASIGGEVVVKIQAWTTGRAGIGGIAFAKSPQEAAVHAARMLGMKVGQFAVTHVLIEEKIALCASFSYRSRSTTTSAAGHAAFAFRRIRHRRPRRRSASHSMRCARRARCRAVEARDLVEAI